MFADSVLVNVAILLLGQVAAWGYLRTGLVVREILLMVGTWVFIDVALVARHAYQSTVYTYFISLSLMQAYSIIEAILFCYGRVWRRLPGVRRRRERCFREAFIHYLRNETEPALKIYKRLLRSDPWDMHVRIALGTAFLRNGESRKARRMFRSARGLDRDHGFRDVIREGLGQ